MIGWTYGMPVFRKARIKLNGLASGNSAISREPKIFRFHCMYFDCVQAIQNKFLERITLFLLFHYTTVTFGMDPTISEAVAHSRIISAEPSSSCIFAWYEIQLHSGPGSYQIPASLKCFMCKISIVPLCQLLVKWKLLRNLQNPTCMNHLIFNTVCHLCVISNHTLS